MTLPTELRALYDLAELFGVERSYLALDGRRQPASPEALLAVTAALGAGISRLTEAPEALRHERHVRERRVLPPVVASFGKAGPPVTLRLPAADAAVDLTVRLEGDAAARPLRPVRSTATSTGVRIVLPPLPHGYHRLQVEIAGVVHETLLVHAPRRAPAMPGRGTGVFLPLHSLREHDDLGVGNFGGLGRLAEWCGGLGADAVSTLPLLATNLDEPFEYSPYAPLSRCFWNEIFLDVNQAPGLEDWAPAREALAAVSADAARLRRQPLVDYRAAIALLRRVLQPLARHLATAPGPHADAFRAFRDREDIRAFARFRAVLGARGEPWQRWPEPLQSGRFEPGTFDPELADYHACVQWLADRQLQAVRAAADRAGVSLYLDLPLGVHPGGYDTFAHRPSFVRGIAVGAPPDPLFLKGQNWGFPPCHPERQREQGYRHPIEVLRHHLRFARILRLDHVMGMHRLFCIPDGMPATDGVYVRYPADEMFAVVTLEAARAGCHVVGEDLGTVPKVIRQRMQRHGWSRLHVLQFQVDPAGDPAVRRAPSGSVSCLNTHDMPTFAGFLASRDLHLQRELGWLDDAGLAEAVRRRGLEIAALTAHLQRRGLVGAEPSPAEVMRAATLLLAAGDSELLLLNLEDLWLEAEPQNVPGTWRERPNWRRRADVTMAAMRERPDVREFTAELIRVRRNRELR